MNATDNRKSGMKFYHRFDHILKLTPRFFKNYIRRFIFNQRIWILPIGLIVCTHKAIECSPTFAGVPVAATFLMHQAYDKFEKEFPGLELPSVFDMNSSEFEYFESTSSIGKLTGTIFGPSEATIIIPVYEKYSQLEEERLGSAGIKKSPVGKVKITGKCQIGCARVLMTQMTLFKLNNEIVWNYS